MTNVIELKKGQLYFLIGFYDHNFDYPSISTYVYDGLDKEYGHLFVSAETYVSKIEHRECDDPHSIAFEEGKINGILDKEHLIKWIIKDHKPNKASENYEYKSA